MEAFLPPWVSQVLKRVAPQTSPFSLVEWLLCSPLTLTSGCRSATLVRAARLPLLTAPLGRALGFGLDHWLIASFAPAPNHTETWNFLLSFNMPIFFWAKNEDIARARQDLNAAGEDLESVRLQTQGTVTALYRQILRSRETALLYRNTLVPLARQAFEVMLVAYQGGKVDFTTLISTFRQWHDARSTYLQAVNALLAGKVALEQAAGGKLQ